MIPTIRVIAILFNLFPGHTNVNAILATLGLPKTVAKADFRRIAILAVAARYLGMVGHHPGRIELLMNRNIGGWVIVILGPRLRRLKAGRDHQDRESQRAREMVASIAEAGVFLPQLRHIGLEWSR